MVNLTKFIDQTKFNIGKSVTAPGDAEAGTSLMKYMDTGMAEIKTPTTTGTTSNLLKYISGDKKTTEVGIKKPVDWLTPDPEMWWNKPYKQDAEWDKLKWWQKGNLIQKRALKDLSVSIPTIGYGLLQWPVTAHRQTLEEGLKGPQVSPTKRLGISPKYTQPTGGGYLPAFIYNLLLAPGQEVVEQLGTQEGRKGIGQSFQQHPLLGPLGTAASLALPLLVAKGIGPKATKFPGVEKGMLNELAPPEPSMPARFVKNQARKFLESDKGMRFKEYTGLLPEQQKYFEMRYEYELAKADNLGKAGRSDLYSTMKAFTAAEKEAFILNLEMAKPKTAQAISMFKKAGIKIPEANPNVAVALELWKKHSAEGLEYMMKATEGTLFKGGARGKILSKSAAKEFRAEVKRLGGLSEEAARPYLDQIPKDLIAKVTDKTKIYEQLNKKAIKKYGTTEAPESVGYITRNGEMIDSSGKRQGSGQEGRIVDHREIAIESGVKLKAEQFDTGGDGSPYMIKFMNDTGDIRVTGVYKGEGANIDIPISKGMPTPAQMKRIKALVDYTENPKIYYDIADIKGNTIIGKEGTIQSMLTDLRKVVAENKATPDANVKTILTEFKNSTLNKAFSGLDPAVALHIIKDATTTLGMNNKLIKIAIKGKGLASKAADVVMEVSSLEGLKGKQTRTNATGKGTPIDVIVTDGKTALASTAETQVFNVVKIKIETLQTILKDGMPAGQYQALGDLVYKLNEARGTLKAGGQQALPVRNIGNEIKALENQLTKNVKKDFKTEITPKADPAQIEYYTNKLKDIEDYIRDSGGIKYSKDMAGEYKKLPFKLKAKKGYKNASSLDEMASDIGNAFPDLGITDGASLLKVLKDLRINKKTGGVQTPDIAIPDYAEMLEYQFLKDFEAQSKAKGFSGQFKEGSTAEMLLKLEELKSEAGAGEKIIKGAEVPKGTGTLPQATQGLSIEEIAKQMKTTPENVIKNIRKFSEMKSEFTELAVDKLTNKFGYKVPIGTKPGGPRGDFIQEARWQPTIQTLEKKLNTKLTIDEIKGLFEEPDYYPHTWPRDPQYRSKAYTGPQYSPGFWKERTGAEGYVREPITSIKNYDWQLIKYKALNEFKDKVFDQFGEVLQPKNPIQAAQMQRGNLTKYGKGKVLYETPEGGKILVKQDMVIPRTIANEFNKMFMDVGRGEMFFRTYFDPITNAWKIPVLALSPRWVVNNVLGNFILNTMGGVGIGGYLDGIGAMGKAFKMMRQAKKSGQPITLVDALVKQGVPDKVAEGIYRGEILGETGAEATGTAAQLKMKTAANVAKYVPEKVYKFNSAIESFFRTSHYFDKMGKGFNPKQALASVNEFLFDYAGLSPVAKSIFRRIDPFWAWHSNIIRLAASYPVNHPTRFAFLQFANKIGNEAYDEKLRDAGVNPDNVPDYYKNMFMLEWKDEEGNNFFISLRGLDPLQDMMIGMGSIHPILKTIIERNVGVQLYNQKAFSSPYTPYGKNEMVTPPMWRHILNNFPQFRVIEDVITPYSRYDTGQLMVDKWGEPVYTKNRLLAVMSILGFNVKPRDIDAIYDRINQTDEARRKRTESYDRALEMFERKQAAK